MAMADESVIVLQHDRKMVAADGKIRKPSPSSGHYSAAFIFLAVRISHNTHVVIPNSRIKNFILRCIEARKISNVKPVGIKIWIKKIFA